MLVHLFYSEVWLCQKFQMIQNVLKWCENSFGIKEKKKRKKGKPLPLSILARRPPPPLTPRGLLLQAARPAGAPLPPPPSSQRPSSAITSAQHMQRAPPLSLGPMASQAARPLPFSLWQTSPTPFSRCQADPTCQRRPSLLPGVDFNRDFEDDGSIPGT